MHQKAFTLIELLIVVAVIGVLAALAVPRFMGSTVHAKQSEAKSILKQIYSMERSYKQEFDTYWGNGISADSNNPNNFARIGVVLGGNSRYVYTIEADQTSFTVTANIPDPLY